MMWSVEVGIHRKTDGHNERVFVAAAAAAAGELISSAIFDAKYRDDLDHLGKPLLMRLRSSLCLYPELEFGKRFWFAESPTKSEITTNDVPATALYVYVSCGDQSFQFWLAFECYNTYPTSITYNFYIKFSKVLILFYFIFYYG